MKTIQREEILLSPTKDVFEVAEKVRKLKGVVEAFIINNERVGVKFKLKKISIEKIIKHIQ